MSREDIEKLFKLKELTLEELKEKLFFAEEECAKAGNYYRHCKEVVRKYRQKIEEHQRDAAFDDAHMKFPGCYIEEF
jgi:tryptophanyl-tRNA synthetase